MLRKIHPKQEINDLYIRGQELDAEKFDYEMRVVSVKCNVRELQRIMEHTNQGSRVMNTVKSVRVGIRIDEKMIDCMPSDEDLDLKRHMRGHVDKSEWVMIDEEAMNKMSEDALMSVLSKVRMWRGHYR